MDESGFLACKASPTHQNWCIKASASKSTKLGQPVTAFSFRPVKIRPVKKRRLNNVFFNFQCLDFQCFYLQRQL
ncbi:hypothetical protein I6J32_11775 [Moraxella osloensis]|nr:hypothetical protein I6J32_11775 [Moraxella osloensis]